MKNNGTMNISIELDRIVSSGSIDPEKVFRIEWRLLKSTGSPSLFALGQASMQRLHEFAVGGRIFQIHFFQIIVHHLFLNIIFK